MTEPDPLEEVRALMDAREREPAHVRHVTKLALRLFDQLQSLHGLGARERLLLEAAARLHDIGHSGEGPDSAHHHESARLIREYDWRAFRPSEVAMIAETARYHRKAPPGPDDQPFAVLLPPVQRVVETLAALLRLADGLDRRHAQVVENLRAEASGERITVHLEARRAPTIEIRAALRKADLARRVFGREIRLKAGQASASGVDEQVDGSMVGVHE